MQETIMHKQGPMDSLDSDYKLNSADRFEVADRATPGATPGDSGGHTNSNNEHAPKGGANAPMNAQGSQVADVAGNDREVGGAAGVGTPAASAATGTRNLAYESRLNPYYTNPYRKAAGGRGNVQGLDSNGSVLSARAFAKR